MAELKLASGLVALVDDDDLAEVIAAGSWGSERAPHTVYVRRKTIPAGRNLYLHTFLTGYAMTDHVSGDGLDNRRVNLRPADNSLNQANRTRLRGRSGYRGVTWHRCGSWQASITVRGRYTYLGLFSTREGAARAYDAAAVEAWGEYARPNFPSNHTEVTR